MGLFMTRTDQKVLFTALGFLAVVINDVPGDGRAARATALADLIEGFCKTMVPDAFGLEGAPQERRATELVLETFIAEMHANEFARLSFARPTLLAMYELLLIQEIRFDQKEFFAFGDEDSIAERIVRLVDERLQREAST